MIRSFLSEGYEVCNLMFFSNEENNSGNVLPLVTFV